jgi:4-amino-4-deoxy-L-arabinose transferase-like glycosyltransferase
MTRHGLLATAFTFFLLNALSQGWVSGTADLDQAQQLLLTQDLSFGYGSQPPLYTWVMHGVFAVTGPSLWALLLFKVLLLTLLVAGAIRVAERLGLSGARLVLTVLGLALLPQFVWESQRDLTHSLLASVCAMWTLAVVLGLRANADRSGYVALGVCVGLGMLAKYNYAFFLAALLLTSASFTETRRALFNPPILLSAGIATLLVMPHALWVVSHHHQAVASSVGKLAINTDLGPATGLINLGDAAFQFALPLLIAWAVSARAWITASVEARFILRLFLVTLGLLILFVLISGTSQIKDRWLQPLLFFLPFLVGLVSDLRPRLYAGLALGVMILVAIALPGRTLLANWTGSPQRPNLPYSTLSEQLRAQVGTPSWIVSDRELLAGNLRLAFPEARVDVVADQTEFSRLERPAGGKIAIFVTDDPRRGAGPGELARALTGGAGLRRIDEPMRYMPRTRHSLYWFQL